MELYIPVIIVVASNTIYHICAKSTPADANTFASLSVTYLVGAAAALAMFFVTRQNTSLLAEYSKLNWSSYALGLAIVGLEAGFLLMYKAGWNVSTGQLVASALLEVVLVAVGLLFYREAITLSKVLGIAVCMCGLFLISR